MESKYAGLEATAELVTQLKGITGDKELLNTTDKSTLVAAVNELFDAIFDYSSSYTFYASGINTVAERYIYETANGNIIMSCVGTPADSSDLGIKYSTDHGATWQSSNITSSYGYKVIYETPDGILFASKTSDGLNTCYSTDHGVTWQGIFYYIGSICRTEDDVLIGAGNQYLYRSVNNGVTWQRYESVTGSNWQITKVHNNVVLATDFSSNNPTLGIWYTSDNGVTWHRSLDQDNAYTITELSDGTLLAASIIDEYSYGMYYSTDHGVTWQQCSMPHTYGIYLVHELSNGTILAAWMINAGGWYYGMYYSTDHGVTWQSTTGISQRVRGICEADNGVAVCCAGALINYSIDHGATWQESSGHDSFVRTCLYIKGNNILFTDIGLSTTTHGILYSTDGGVTVQSSNVTSGADFSVCKLDEGTIALSNRNTSVSSGIMYSTDNGATWQNSSITSGQYTLNLLSDDSTIANGSNGIKYGRYYKVDPSTLKPKWETAIEALAAQLNA